MATFRQEGLDAWRKRHSKVFIPVQDDGQQYTQHFDISGVKRPALSLLEVFDAVKECKPMFYNKMQFLPFSRRDPRLGVAAEFKTFNSFSGLVAERDGLAMIDSGKCDDWSFEKPPAELNILLNHIKEVWANGDFKGYVYLIKFFADIVQHPGKRTPKIPILRSDFEGAIKNVIITFFSTYVVGSEYIVQVTTRRR